MRTNMRPQRSSLMSKLYCTTQRCAICKCQRFPEIGIQKLVAAVFRCFENRCAPLLRMVDGPVLELAGGFAQNVAARLVLLAIGVEETDHSFRLLKRLNQPVEQQPVEAPVAESDANLGDVRRKRSWRTPA